MPRNTIGFKEDFRFSLQRICLLLFMCVCLAGQVLNAAPFQDEKTDQAAEGKDAGSADAAGVEKPAGGAADSGADDAAQPAAAGGAGDTPAPGKDDGGGAEEETKPTDEKDDSGGDAKPEVPAGKLQNFFEPDVPVEDFVARNLHATVLLTKIQRANAESLKNMMIDLGIKSRVSYTIENVGINQLLSRMVMDKAVSVHNKGKLVYIKPYVDEVVQEEEDGLIPFFTPDIPLGTLVANDIPVSRLLRRISVEKKADMVVENDIPVRVILNFTDPNNTINQLLNLLIQSFPITCERVGAFVYVRSAVSGNYMGGSEVPPKNDILYDQTNERIAFILESGVPVGDLAQQIMEVTGKAVLLRKPFHRRLLSIQGVQSLLPFDKGLKTLMLNNNLGLETQDDVYYLTDHLDGVRLRNGLLDVRYDAAPLQDVLRDVASTGAASLMVVSELKGNVSVDATGVTVEQLLRMMLADSDYSYELQEGDVFLVGERKSPLLQESAIVKFEEVHVDVVEGMLPKSLTDGVTVTKIDELNSLMITGDRTRVWEVEAVARNLDQRVAQVLLEVLIVQFSQNDTLDVGLNILTGDGQSLFPNINLGFDGFRDDHGSYTISRLPSNFTILLNALEQKGLAKVITKPHIATLSGQAANLKVGQTLYYRIETEEIVGTDNPRIRTTQKIESVEANTSLDITPWVMSGDLLTVKIQPKIDSFDGQVVDNVPPGQNNTSLESLVRLRDGETIILGGLMIDTNSLNRDGLPWLSRIPVLGALFRNRKKTKVLSDTVVYVTPHVYYSRTDEDTGEFIKDKELLDYNKLKEPPKDARKDGQSGG